MHSLPIQIRNDLRQFGRRCKPVSTRPLARGLIANENHGRMVPFVGSKYTQRLEQLNHVVLRSCEQCPARPRIELLPHALSRCDVSVSGSTLIEIKWKSLSTRSPINFWSLEKCAPIGGQIVVQVVKMKLIAITLFLTRSL